LQFIAPRHQILSRPYDFRYVLHGADQQPDVGRLVIEAFAHGAYPPHRVRRLRMGTVLRIIMPVSVGIQSPLHQAICHLPVIRMKRGKE
jgi:hypothetical protein